MILRPLDDFVVEKVLSWLTDDENAKWLDFGETLPVVSRPMIQYMHLKESNSLKIFTDDERGEAIGMVALSHINLRFYSAMIWYVLGEKEFKNNSYTTRAVSKMCFHGFNDIKLNSIYAWTVELNQPSIRVLEKNQFTLVGKQRQGHMIDGRYYDRLIYDLLAEEYVEFEMAQ